MLIPILIHTKYDFPLIFNKLGTPHYNNESIRVSHPSGDDQSELYSWWIDRLFQTKSVIESVEY